MRFVQVQEPIQIVVSGEPWKDSNGQVDPPWSFAHYLRDIVLNDPAMGGTGYKVLKACNTIDSQFENAVPGTWVAVEDAHWEMLKNTVENPKGGGIPPSILRQFIPNMDAILNAKTKKPDETT